MSNSLLTPTTITREALRVLHQKLNYVGTVNRQYDDRFANSGAKIGETLQIRLPNEFTVRTGKTLDAQDVDEKSVALTVATQKGVDMNFSTRELTMTIDEFSARYIDPAMSVLAANIEADAMNMYKDVYNEISDVGAAISTSGDLSFVLKAAKVLTDNLAPVSGRSLNLNTQDNVDLVNALKGLFNDPAKVSKQYREGMVASNFLGFADVFQNTLWPVHVTGSDDGTGDYLTDINAGEDNGSDGSLHVDTGAGTFKKGDVIYIEDVYRVHPETKVNTGKLQPFVVTADFAGGEGDLKIAPSIIASGARQNVNAPAVDGKKIMKVESDGTTPVGANADYNISLAYHKDAFAFATADLIKPEGVHFSGREVLDGISMRIVRQYDINNDNLPCRIDVLYGYKAIRPQLACRLGFN